MHVPSETELRQDWLRGQAFWGVRLEQSGDALRGLVSIGQNDGGLARVTVGETACFLCRDVPLCARMAWAPSPGFCISVHSKGT